MKKLNRFLKMAAVLIALGHVTDMPLQAGAERLYVFYPSVMSAASLQKELNEACPGIEITVFGRFKDFEDGVISRAPEAILTKPDVIGQIGGYAVRLNGSRKGDTEESYIFLSVNRQIDVSSLSGKSVGVFDILGRKGMEKFVGKFLNPVPQLQRVSKIEDLLQLLTFNMAEAILIPEVYADYYKKISKLNFAKTPLPNMKAGILSLGVKQGKEAALTVKALTALNERYMSLLEVDKWK